MQVLAHQRLLPASFTLAQPAGKDVEALKSHVMSAGLQDPRQCLDAAIVSVRVGQGRAWRLERWDAGLARYAELTWQTRETRYFVVAPVACQKAVPRAGNEAVLSCAATRMVSSSWDSLYFGQKQHS